MMGHATPLSTVATPLVLAMAALLTTATTSGAAQAATRTWDFQVTLDGKSIGTHRFTVQDDGKQRTVTNAARFTVKVLGLVVYRYAIDAEERWQGDCLESLRSRTNDDGEALEVQATRNGSALQVRNKAGQRSTEGCLTGYAYWLPEVLARQSRLLNPQTGDVEPVTMAAGGSGSIDVGGQRVSARKLRVGAPPGPIDVWVGERGDWLGLDAQVRGGRVLSYRLAAPPAWWSEPSRPPADGAHTSAANAPTRP